jgi:hypothetical protein
LCQICVEGGTNVSKEFGALIVEWLLDHANRKIDGFIRAKRKLIALLNEQKSSAHRRM